ncbi:hypothetical protein KIN20_034773 [Parelaphostrongylus tenuis]|uniref:Uncharacterized protein n=1 Tax=Parelaphostrongylus tenuis TaxID=148309 RepID=A0AAD5RA65_PARTN|nr:hypothetical protein KIN20_034773 [Parelaphostrongylus tenuis]
MGADGKKVLHVPPFDDEFSDITTTSSANQEHSDIPVTYCLAAYPYEQPGYNCAAQDCPPHLEERRQCIPSLCHLDDLNQRRVAQWRHRIAAMAGTIGTIRQGDEHHGHCAHLSLSAVRRIPLASPLINQNSFYLIAYCCGLMLQ